ncbi:PREDICTED: splicing regulatory glutamine/lysine-rich protein 1 isoform X1 [Nicotiana attenuata]|uniref:splicing regulatory glutamine/lysine-rich protein 1 isoform X1 n=1 Tax=Nicotiana attenuata TaxID=49451 RepID=UPI0009058A6D|nr:PREDICTED: splicing regulatory glutamine/lysine-rich protein 1 isoform X1 [Nicotiana attenuata]XP_019245286.1 PREDICTED: splicing regulatory glutamine/lysine-rich protein 1 isoform X1 [Nicotiana attenuata]
MDLDGKSSPQENVDSKGAFRKLSNDAANRKYRRRSPVGGGSSSSDGSPARQRSSSPIPSRKDEWRHKDDDLDRNSSRQGRIGESHRQSDRQSSRSSRSHHRNEDYSRHDRHTDDDDKGYSKLSSHSHRDSRVNNYSNNSRRDNDHRSRVYPRDIDKHYRGRYDDSGHRSKDRERETSSFKDRDPSFDRVGSGRRYNNSSIDDSRYRERDRYKESRDSRDEKGDHRSDHKSDNSPAYEDSRSNRNESNSRKDSSGHRLKEASQFDEMVLDGEKYIKEERKKYEDRDQYKERSYYRETKEKFEDRNVEFGKGRESPAKKSKFSGMEQSSEQGIDGMDPASAADGELSSSSKQGQGPNSELALEQGVKDSDIDAAKVAAMKAAELVNRNLIGTGIMTADQKKKLLWGNKKTTTDTEESTHRWDTSLFGDRERQEKFNKLMSLRLPWYIWPIVGCERRREDGEQTSHPRRREAEGAPDGFGEAIYCWTSPKRWPYSWTRALRFCLNHLCTFTRPAVVVLCYFALLELHVLSLSKLCILKSPVFCDYG